MYNNPNSWSNTVITPRAPNVLFTTGQGTTIPDNLLDYLKGDVLDITLQAAKQRPAWKFYMFRTGGNLSTNTYIYCGEERLGHLIMELYYARDAGASYRASITCPALGRMMVRKNGVASANPKRVLKALLDNCRETPQKDVAANRLNAAQLHVQRVLQQNLAYTIEKDLDPNTLLNFLQERGLWKEFSAAAVKAGAPAGFASQVEEKVALRKTAANMIAIAALGRAFMARAAGDDYYAAPVLSLYTYKNGLNEPVLYTKDKHTDEFKTNVGILKLAPENLVVDGVGYKQANEDSLPVYFVVLEGGLG